YMNASLNPQSINFTIEIENTGSENESVNVTITFDDPSKPIAGWTVNPYNFTVNSIEAGFKVEREIMVTAPVDEPYPSFAQLTVLGWVQENTSQTSQDNFIARVSPIYDAQLIPQQDILFREPGDMIVIILQLTNTGTATDTLSVEDTTAPPYDVWGILSPPSTVTLAPGNSTNMTYTIFVDLEVTLAESPITLTLAVNSTGEGDFVDTTQITIFINQTYGVRITTTQNEKTGDPGEEVSFEIKVTNQGNGNDTIRFSHIGDELGVWSVSNIDLEPDEFIFVYYNITIHPQHNTSDIHITLNASSEGDASGLSYDTLDLTIHVNPRYEVYLIANGTNQKKVSGGQSVIFNLTIQNRGTATDTYDIVPKGTTSSWVTPETSTLTLDPDEKVTIEILVSPPEGTEVKLHNITINVTSQEDESATEEFNFYADVGATYDLFLSVATSSQTVDPGYTATFVGVTIENKGNAQDTFTFHITNMTAGWSHSPLYSYSVPADESMSFDLDVTTTSTSAPGYYELYLTAVSEGDDTKQQTITLTVKVNQIYDVELPSSVSGKNVEVGEVVTYLINVKNLGNGDDYIELWLTGDVESWTWLYYNASENGSIIQISVPAGGTGTVILYLAPPLDYWDTHDGTEMLDINAESLNDPDIIPASDSVTVLTDVNHVYGVDILTGGFTAGDPGETLSFLFEVENTGTDTDNYNIRVDSISTQTGGDTSLWIPAVSFNPTTISNLAPGQIIMMTMYVDIPFPSDLSLIPPGLYNITVEVSSASDSNIKDTQVFTVDVQQYYWADIQNSVTTKNVDVGSSVVYSITIKNKGNGFDLLSVELEGDPAIPGSVNWGKLSHSGTGQIDKQVLVDIDLEAGESTDIELEITIPDRTHPSYPPVDPDDVTLTVVVRPSDENGVDDQVPVTADINPIYEFDFNFLAQTMDVFPGDEAVFTMNIENTGTITETFTYEIYQWHQSDWSAYGYTFTPPSGNLQVGAGYIGQVTLRINTPSAMEEAESRDYKITIRVHSETGGADRFRNCTVHIEPVFDVELTINDQTSKSVNVGESVNYQFSIKNTGNIHETFQFTVIDMDTSPGGGGDQSNWVDLYLQSAPSTPVNSIYLSYGERETMILKISVPPQGDPNFVELSAPLDIKIEANSMQEPPVKDSFTTSTTVNPIYSFDLSTTAPGNTKSGEPGDTVSFTLQVRN
ncbi:MAG: hypothetical protein JSV09_01315, partial [Thermoplasmata archaeon]